MVGALGGLAQPALQGLISRQVSEQEQGRAMGAVTSLGSLVGVVGPVLATGIYAQGVGAGFPGAGFAFGGALSLLGTLLMGRTLRRLAAEDAAP